MGPTNTLEGVHVDSAPHAEPLKRDTDRYAREGLSHMNFFGEGREYEDSQDIIHFVTASSRNKLDQLRKMTQKPEAIRMESGLRGWRLTDSNGKQVEVVEMRDGEELALDINKTAPLSRELLAQVQTYLDIYQAEGRLPEETF